MMNSSNIDKYEKNDEIAINKILVDMIAFKNKTINILIFLLTAVITVLLLFTAGVFIYFSQTEEVVETYSEVTSEISQEVEGDNAEINNVSGNQYKDNAVHNEEAY